MSSSGTCRFSVYVSRSEDRPKSISGPGGKAGSGVDGEKSPTAGAVFSNGALAVRTTGGEGRFFTSMRIRKIRRVRHKVWMGCKH